MPQIPGQQPDRYDDIWSTALADEHVLVVTADWASSYLPTMSPVEVFERTLELVYGFDERRLLAVLRRAGAILADEDPKDPFGAFRVADAMLRTDADLAAECPDLVDKDKEERPRRHRIIGVIIAEE